MEHEFHQWIKQQFNPPAPTSCNGPVILGPGDDGAVLGCDQDRSIVIATDTIAQGTHFDLEVHSLESVGRKALAVNLSDIAAMGSNPEFAVLNFMLPSNFGLVEAKAIFRGASQLAEQFGVAIVGGDSNRWDGKLVVGATVLGSRATSETGWSIAGAKPGHAILVTGEFGGSITGRHMTFEPRVDLANHLASNYQIAGATDASDSLSLDLNAMLLASSSPLGANLDLDAIPIASAVQEPDPSKRLNHALTDGEDFELILSVSAEQADLILADQWILQNSVTLTRIGTFTDQHNQIRAIVDGETITISPKGYVH